MRQIDLLEEIYLNENLKSFMQKQARQNATMWTKFGQHMEAKPQYKKFRQLGGNLTYEEYRSKLRSKDLKNHFGGRTIKKTDYPEINKYLASKYHD